jgi:predicted permease
MNSLRVLASRLVASLFRRRRDRELSDEIQAHLDALTDDYVRGGMSLAAARAAARREFGGVMQMRETYRDQRGLPLVDALQQDLRYAWRTLLKARGFTLVVVLTLAIGIGANTAIFSVLNAVMFRPLPVPNPEELFVAVQQSPRPVAQALSFPLFERLRAAAADSPLAAVTRVQPVPAVVEGGEAERVKMQLVSGEYFSVMSLRPALGRLLTADDSRTVGGRPVMVIGHDFWRRRFGASPDVLGRTVMVNGADLTIVGVAPAGFSGEWLERSTDLWIPATMQNEIRYKNNYGHTPSADDSKPWVPQEGIQWVRVIGRADPARREAIGTALALAFQQDRTRVAANIENPDVRRAVLQQRLTLEPFARGFSAQRDGLTTPLFALLAIVTLTLLISCANTANLLLARASTRQREIAIRLSMGAGRGRLIRQLLTETTVLVGVATTLGVLFAYIVGPALASRLMDAAPGDSVLAVPLDARVLGYTGLVSIVTAMLFGLAPAFRTTRVDLGTTLKLDTRTMRGASRLSAPKLLVALQVALSLLLVVGAGLFGRSFRNLTRTDLGFEPDRVVSANINLRVVQYPVGQLPDLYRRLVERLEALPGVQSAANSTCLLATNCHRGSGLKVVGYQPPSGEQIQIEENYVSHRFFSTVGMRLLAGRDFDERDTEKAPKVAVVNETLARQFFGSRNVVGAHLGHGQPDIEIVGVVQEARVTPVRDQPLPMAYLPIQQGPGVYASALEVKAAGNPKRLTMVAVRKAIAEVAPSVPIEQVGLLSEQVSRNVDQERLVAVLTGAFGLLALGLSSFGLVGVMSFTVARRTAEIGLRLALGAQRARVLSMILRESLLPVAIGVVVGLSVVLAVSRLLAGMLFGLTPNDPLTIAGATTTLVTVSTLAGFFPAWQASRVDPMVALRHE